MSARLRRATPLCASLVGPLLYRKVHVASRCDDLGEKSFDCISLQDSSEHRLGRGGPIQVVPVFALGGVSCFLPHTGTQRLHVYEPKYRQLYTDLLGEAAGDASFQKTRMSKSPVLLAAWIDADSKSVAAVGVILELLDWARISEEPPVFAATHKAGQRARILRFIRPEKSPEHDEHDTYMLAEIELLDDSPGFSDHAAASEAWRDAWRSLAKLVEVQQRLQEEPRLTEAVLSLGPARCSGILSAQDVWRPLALVQELQRRQASAAHRTYGAKIAAAAEAGQPFGELQQRYKEELQRLQCSLSRCPAILQMASGVELLQEASRLVDAEVKRLEGDEE